MNYSPLHLAKLIEVVVPIHGNKDLAKGTFLSILKQAGISKDEV